MPYRRIFNCTLITALFSTSFKYQAVPNQLEMKIYVHVQVLGLPYAEEIQFHADVSDSLKSCAHDCPVPTKRQKLSHPKSSPAIKAESSDADPRYHADSTDSKQRQQSMRSMVIVEGLDSLRGLDKLVSAARRAEMPHPGRLLWLLFCLSVCLCASACLPACLLPACLLPACLPAACCRQCTVHVHLLDKS